MNFCNVRISLLISLVFLLFIIRVQGQCLINNLKLTQSPCNSSGQFFVEIDFVHSGAGTQFRILGNGNNYGIFEYANLPVTIGPLSADCSTLWEFAVRDLQNPNCLAFRGLGKVCCNVDCRIQIHETTGTACNGLSYTLGLDLLHNQPPDSRFRVFSNGVQIGEYRYGQLPLQIENVRTSIFETFNQIVVCAADNTTCCDTFRLLNPCICTIYDLRVLVAECSDSLQQFDVRINFRHNLTSDSFQIGGNVTNYGRFAYKDLPVRLSNLEMNSLKDYEFLVVDLQDAFCFSAYELGVVDSCTYDCKLEAKLTGTPECSDSIFYQEIALDARNYGFKGFVIESDDYQDTIRDGRFNFRAGPFRSLCENEKILKIRDSENSGCLTELILEAPICCEPRQCLISGLQISENCENNDLLGFDLFLDYFESVSDSFRLETNGIYQGTFAYAELPLRFTQIQFGLPEVRFTLYDTANTMCRLDTQYVFRCYPESTCKISDVNILSESCTDEWIQVSFSLININGTTGFDVYANGLALDNFTYGNEEYQLNLPKSFCEENFILEFRDAVVEDCKSSIEMNSPECCTTCNIAWNMWLNFSACLDGRYDLSVSFQSSNTSDSFALYLDNQLVGIYDYNDLPVNIRNLEGAKYYGLEVRDLADPGCVRRMEFNNEECTSNLQNILISDPVIISLGNGILQIQANPVIRLPYYLTISDLNGQQIYTAAVYDETFAKSTGNLADGLYIITVWNHQFITHRKFIYLSR